MDWQTRRKIIYFTATLFTIAAISIYVFREKIFPSPTCFDTKQNGYEVGIDCGGVCSLRCSSEVAPLEVLWTRALQTSSTTYDLVAMISNKNIDNASQKFSYIFTVYDNQGQVMEEISGSTFA